MAKTKKRGRGGHPGRADKTKESPQYSPFEISRIIAETRALEMQHLIYESDKAFRMLMEEEDTYPADPDSQKAENG